MAFYNKLKWILGILLIFVLIVSTNLIDRNNFIQVKNSVVTIYEDRLIANDLIFEMLKSVRDKEIAIYTSDSISFKKEYVRLNKNIQSKISEFEKTKLTLAEEKVFADFKKNINSLIEIENKSKRSYFDNKVEILKQLTKTKANLDDLAKIQLNEGNRQMAISKKAIDTVELFTQIEIYLLVFLALVIQILVIYNPKKTL